MNTDYTPWPVMDSGLTSNAVSIRKQNTPATNDFDPYQAMLDRKKKQQEEENGEYKKPEVTQYDSEDIKALEEFCKQYGIMGFNSGTMHPKTALRMLKSKIGLREPEPTVIKKQMLMD